MFKSKVECDRCQKQEQTGPEGGIPSMWSELNLKTGSKRKMHLCELCTQDLIKFVKGAKLDLPNQK